MNRIVLLTVLILVISCSFIPKKDGKKIDIQINIANKVTSEEFEKLDGFFYFISINLINYTDSTLYFWSMTCSWEENWVFNNNVIKLYGHACDNNSPCIRMLEPGKSFNFKGIVHIFEDLKYIENNGIRLGFVFINKNEISNVSSFREILDFKFKERKDIIWSGPLKIIE